MPKQDQEKIGVIFVHGAGLNSGIWNKVALRLDHPSLLIDFPFRGSYSESDKGLSLADYVTCIKKQVEAWEVRRFVVVAHSLGGVVALRIASDLSCRLAGFVAVGAAIPKNGGSFLSTLPFLKRILMGAILRKIGTEPPESVIRAGLCNDLTSEQSEGIVREFIPESIRVYTDRTGVSVPNVPKLYVKLTRDKEFSSSLQNRMIANFSPQEVRTMESGHLPMISDPNGLRNVLQEFMTTLESSTRT